MESNRAARRTADITVLLPVHNGANYLREAIDSVLAQSYDSFVLEVLDDGSTDDTAKIVESFVDSRVRYSRNPQRLGLFGTLNRGFAEAKTEFVRLWAHDDRMLRDNLLKLGQFAREHPEAGMVYCDFYGIDETGQRTGEERQFAAQRVHTPDIATQPLSALLFFCFGCLPGNISTVMLRRSAWESAGGFRTGWQQSPDYDMWVRISNNHPVGFVREKLMELRCHEGQLGRTGQKVLSTIDEEFEVYKALSKCLAGMVSDRELRVFWRWQRGRQHAHWTFRALARGDLGTAAKGWRAMARYGDPVGQVLTWLVSLNGRWCPVPATGFFDKVARRVSLQSH
jgi:glycosyltransferase involved in cell wall biosynthesis